MDIRVLLCAALCAASPVVVAQDDKPAAAEAAMPNPKHAQHDALKALAGTWDSHFLSEAMPGVPGMEKPTESKGIEHAELICDGLYLKSVVRSTWNDQPFEALFLVGYDPFQKKYVGVWVGSNDDEPGASIWDGSYDASSKTWTWRGNTPHGEMRSTVAFTDPNHTVETCYLKGPDGNETKCVEIKRSRSKVVATADAVALAKTAATAKAAMKSPQPLAKEQEILLKDVGKWDAVVEMAMAPGQAPTKEKATETITSICNGRWLWSEFKGQFAGAPFTGHALCGYDPGTKKYVSYWIDSMSPVWMTTSGDHDAAKSVFTFTGSAVDGSGNPMTVKEKITSKDDDTRVMEMEFKHGAETSNMVITYKRAQR